MRKLVVYFSASGVTKRAAEELAAVSGSSLFEIKPAIPYTSADLNWRDRGSRSSVEMRDPGSRVEMEDGRQDLEAYDTIYIGFPVWWGVAPHIINSFIEMNDLKGKRLVVFATSGGSQATAALKDLQKRYRELPFTGGVLLNGTVTKDII